MSKTLSFSLYGDDPKYVVGAYKNILLAEQLLPEWITTIYCAESLTNPHTVKDLSSKCLVKDPTHEKLPLDILTFPAFWRFFSFFDNNPALSRDLDSRISEREVSYINAWLNSDKDIFIIKDHPWQSLAPAGLIGMRNCGKIFKEFFIDFISNNSVAWGQDQVILERFIEYYALQNNIFYCSYETNNYIPRDNKSFFIGIQLDEHDNAICPQSITYLCELNR